MNGSKLTAEHIGYICREYMEPQLVRAQAMLAKSETGSLYANVCDDQVKKITEIFIAVGYWQERSGK